MQETIITLNKGLYPFGLNDLNSFDYGDYHLQNVFESITEEQRQRCVEMWVNNGAIPNRPAAYQRSKQVCYFITERCSGNLIGVNTLYLDHLDKNEPALFFNRMFIVPKHRDSRLMITGTAMMLCFARTKLANRGVNGVININENTKLSRPGMHRIFTRLGYQRIGHQRNQEILYFAFASTQFNETD